MKYRILSLDGFGVWALIEVKALIALYGPSATGHDVLKDFDLVAGNSGGSIVLGTLVADLPLGKILNLFKNEKIRRSVFPLGSFTDVLLHDAAKNVSHFLSEDNFFNLNGIFPKYSARNKLKALKKILRGAGGELLPDAAEKAPHRGGKPVHLLITAFDYDLNRAVFFRSSKIKRPQWGQSQASQVTLAEAIHASSNAPVNYFDSPAEFERDRGRYWDGAIAGCNNPVLAAVTEAIGKNQKPEKLAVLSIGTAVAEHCRPKPGEPCYKGGITADLRKLALAIIDDPPDIATFLAHVMTGSGQRVNRPADSRVVRMNPLMGYMSRNGSRKLPGSMTEAELSLLKNMDLDALRPSQVDAIENYADLWLNDEAPNQPIRTNGKTLKKELGQNRFSEARAAWNVIK